MPINYFVFWWEGSVKISMCLTVVEGGGVWSFDAGSIVMTSFVDETVSTKSKFWVAPLSLGIEPVTFRCEAEATAMSYQDDKIIVSNFFISFFFTLCNIL